MQNNSFYYMSIIYLIIFFVAIIYNISHLNMVFVYLWSALFLGNLAFLIYSFVRNHKKNKKQ